MSEPEDEGFVARWARRKREAAETIADAPPAAAPAEAPPAASAQEPPAAEPPTLDLSALPSIDQITAATDIRPFLAPGVPAELTRAALRRAWVADPQIRDFVGIAENQWDFTDPNAMPGFGPLGPLDDIAKLVARVVGGLDAAADLATPAASAAPPSPPPLPDGDDPASSATMSAPDATAGESAALECQHAAAATMPATGVQRKVDADETIAAQETQETGDTAPGSVLPIRRGHGGALPS